MNTLARDKKQYNWNATRDKSPAAMFILFFQYSCARVIRSHASRIKKTM